ncbi:MAG: YidC/Oxa1 family membrane protein insertase [Candidatus Yanofskybacteria bacterium]|nr:YidC/Oxa1 family membrane protein insertase [Candidatus Yanofskybacteria bacterium]
MGSLFHELLSRPLFNLLIGLYNLIPGQDFGIAILALTAVVRLIMLPLSLRASRSQRELAKLNPKLKEVQEKYKNDKQAQASAQMQLYKEHNINPLAGCLPLLIQIPIIIALYRTFLAGFKPESLQMLYSFVQNPGTIHNIFLGFLDLTQKSPVLAVLAGVFQYFQSRMSVSQMPQSAGKDKMDITGMMSTQMLYFFPVMIIIITWNLPAGLALYWVATTIFSIGEQFYIRRRYA